MSLLRVSLRQLGLGCGPDDTNGTRMNEHIKLAVAKAREGGSRVFFYSAQVYPGTHNAIEICLECDTILIPEEYRDQLAL